MGKQLVVHFGAGALGRGLVVPIMYESGCDIVLLDTNKELIEKIKETNSYALRISDAKEHPVREIKVKDALVIGQDEDKVIAVLQETDTVTTSVCRVNLIHVARTLAKAWGNRQDTSGKRVICCENVEGVGAYFKELLLQNALNPAEKEILNQVIVPDTIVDRICATGGNDPLEITSELFHECRVAKETLPDTGIELIPSVENIKGHFYRKRYLLNTYSDAISFIGRSQGLLYLYEAVSDKQSNELITPYMDLLKQLLHQVYGFEMCMLNEWQKNYQKRLSNPEIPRTLDTVARNLWGKMTLTERFIYPLIELQEAGFDVTDGLAFIHLLIEKANNCEENPLSKKEINKELEKLWSDSDSGKKLLDQYRELG